MSKEWKLFYELTDLDRVDVGYEMDRYIEIYFYIFKELGFNITSIYLCLADYTEMESYLKNAYEKSLTYQMLDLFKPMVTINDKCKKYLSEGEKFLIITDRGIIKSSDLYANSQNIKMSGISGQFYIKKEKFEELLSWI